MTELNAREALKLLDSSPKIEISTGKETIASLGKSILSLQYDADQLYKQWTELILAERFEDAKPIKEKYDAVCLVIDSMRGGLRSWKHTDKAKFRDYSHIINKPKYNMYA